MAISNIRKDLDIFIINLYFIVCSMIDILSQAQPHYQ